MLRDSISELACGKVLFETVATACELKEVEAVRAAKWREMAQNMAELPKLEIGGEMLEKKKALLGLGKFKGDMARSKEMFAAGWGIEEKRLLSSVVPRKRPNYEGIDDVHELIQKREAGRGSVTAIKNDWDYYAGIFPCVEFAPVYPAGTIGLANKGSDDFRAAVNTAKLYTPTGTGWDPLPIVLARLGLGRELAEILQGYPERWQIYVNGWTHWGIRENAKAEGTLRFLRNRVVDVGLEEGERLKEENKVLFGMWPFRHASLEAMYVLATAMNEALLQSHEGVIRVAPAVGRKQEAKFSLHAAGGFVVSAEIAEGKVAWVGIQSRRGGTCRVANPWRRAWVCDKQGVLAERAERVVEMKMSRGENVVLVPDRKVISRWRTKKVDYAANEVAHSSRTGMARLGLPRLF